MIRLLRWLLARYDPDFRDYLEVERNRALAMGAIPVPPRAPSLPSQKIAADIARQATAKIEPLTAYGRAIRRPGRPHGLR